MTAAGVSALAGRYRLGPEAGLKLAALLAMFVTDARAPTSVRDPESVLNDHLADSLVALELEALLAARRVVDIGSGAGLPALPLAIALPKARVVALDSTSRKTAFVSRAIEHCAIDNACAVTARAEDWTAGEGRFDVVTARALAPLEVVAEYAAPLLRVGGRLISWRGRREAGAEAAAEAAAPMLGLKVGEIHRVEPYAGAQHRHLHVITKVQLTSERFPRRAGVARKRPLGSGQRASDRSRR